MKKSTILAVCLLAAVGLRFSPVYAAEPALAEEEMLELNWEDEEDSDIPGEFVELGEPLVKFFLPEVLLDEEVSEEEKEAGLLGAYSDEEGETTMFITYLDMLCADVFEYGDFIEEEYGVEVSYLRLNGLDAVCYSMEEDDELYVALVPDEDYVLEFSFWPLSDDDFFELAQVVAASIQGI